MGKRKHIPSEIKEQVLHRIRTEGISAADAAKEHGINTQTVYAWLRRSAVMPSNVLQMNKLKRENEELKRLLGEVLLEKERSKKKNRRHAV